MGPALLLGGVHLAAVDTPPLVLFHLQCYVRLLSLQLAPVADVWSFGVICWEAYSGIRAYCSLPMPTVRTGERLFQCTRSRSAGPSLPLLPAFPSELCLVECATR